MSSQALSFHNLNGYVIRDIGGGTRPGYHQPPLIEQQTQFAPDDPAVIGEAFAADLLRATALAHGVDQLDAVGVNDPDTVGAAKKAVVQS